MTDHLLVHVSSKLGLLLLNNVSSDSQNMDSILHSITAASFTRYMHHKRRPVSSQLFVFLSSGVNFFSTVTAGEEVLSISS